MTQDKQTQRLVIPRDKIMARWGESLVFHPFDFDRVSSSLCALLRQVGHYLVTAHLPGNHLSVRRTQHVLRYYSGQRLFWVAAHESYWAPAKGFRIATDEEQSCEECQRRAESYTLDQGWKATHNPREICPKCTRTPLEYLLAHTPEHAVWFERMTRLTAHKEQDRST